jgi:hypothetical protein
MITNLVLGTMMLVLCLGIQCFVVALLLRGLVWLKPKLATRPSTGSLTGLLMAVIDMGPESGPGHASVDRVLVRSSNALGLEPLTWRTDGRFVDSMGEALSDHPAIAVRIAWNARDKASAH